MSQTPNYGESDPTRPIDPSSTPYSSPPSAPSSGGYSYPPTSGAPGYPSSGAPGYPTSGAPAYDPNAGQAGYGQAYPQQGYQQPGYQQPQPGYQQPYAAQPPAPVYAAPAGAGPAAFDPQGRPYSDKSKTAAGLLQIFLGGFGVGRFYTGHVGIAVAQLLVSLFTCYIGSLWGFIDGIIILVNGGTDAEGRVLRP